MGNPSPKLHKCACGEPVILGWDQPQSCALQVILDPYPITAAGEVAALRDQRPTYKFWNNRIQLRDKWNLPGSPPAHHRLILATHRCGVFIDLAHRLPKKPVDPIRAEDLEPPF